MAEPIEIVNVNKSFGAFRALKDVSLSIAPGEIFFLLGPSGCGKTTLLRTVAGFCAPDEGSIRVGGRDVTRLKPEKRDMGMMFQSYALWPHLTIAENVSFGLEMRGVPRAARMARVQAALASVHLDARAHDRPNALSGGQQQRVALARALVVEPSCLLLDEPLSNLDAKLRQEMRSEIRATCKSRGLTALYVTHDRQEALSCADRLAVMEAGRVVQVGTPQEVYRHPVNAFVASFMGEANFLEGQVASCGSAGTLVVTPYGRFVVEGQEGPLAAGTPVTLCIRPESLRRVSPAEAGAGGNVLSGSLAETTYLGEMTRHLVRVAAKGAPARDIIAYELGEGAGRMAECGLSVRSSDIVMLRRPQ